MQYAILPTNRDIIHRSHKYIDKKRGKNGKWIYYYTNKPSLRGRLGIYAKENLEQTEKKVTKTSNTTQNTINNAESNIRRLQDERSKWQSGEYFDKEDHNPFKGSTLGPPPEPPRVGNIHRMSDAEKAKYEAEMITYQAKMNAYNIRKEAQEKAIMDLNKRNEIKRIEKEMKAYDDIIGYAKSADNKRKTAARKAYMTYASTPIGKLESAGEAIKKAYNSGLDWLYKKLKI